ncbi:MAG: ATP-binding protein [Lacrimispora sp.]|uniref:ATP-binding protein n=1 Tax=Lacrimispora sp. TaxID=2719234 RepID=UPI0039E4DE26
MIQLGKVRNKGVYFNSENSFNDHTLILGKSGAGKTVFAEKMLLQIIKEGGTIVAIDLHQAMNTDKIPEEFREEFIKNSHEVKAHDSGIPCPLFTPMRLSDQKYETFSETVLSVTNMLAQAFQLQFKQKAALKAAVEYVCANDLYRERGIKALSEPLLSCNTDSAVSVAYKLEGVIEHNIFVDGSLFIQENKINMVRLSQFDTGTQVDVAEVILSYIWGRVSLGKIPFERLYICIDEFHVISLGNKSTIAQILSEGRKFNTNLILITQSLTMYFNGSQQKRLMQSGLQIYFRPPGNESRIIARLLEPDDVRSWEQILRGLQRGEFIGSGPLLINGVTLERPLKITSY